MDYFVIFIIKWNALMKMKEEFIFDMLDLRCFVLYLK